MAKELLLINPRRRSSRRKRRAPTTRRRRRTYARRNPTRRSVAASNPRRRRSRRRHTYARRNPSRARRYYGAARRGYARFRGSNIGAFVSGKLVPAAVGATGALALDLGWGYLPLPDQIKSGMLAPIARIGGAIIIGYGVSAVAGRRAGEEAMAGALIVTLYDLFKTTLKANTNLPLSGLGYASPAMLVGDQEDYDRLEYGNGLGMYVGRDDDPDVFMYGPEGGEFTGNGRGDR